MSTSINNRAWAIAQAMIADAETLRIGVTKGPAGETLIDAGAKSPGGIAAGIGLARICMGGLADIRVGSDPTTPAWPWSVSVQSSQPVTACLASQYAGWSLSAEAPDKFFALGSGPARSLARKEELFSELAYTDDATQAVLVMESGKAPPASVLEKIARDCKVAAENLVVLFAPTQSLAGSVQVVARVLEVALHKAHAVHFPLDRIVDGMGTAPLSPPHPDFVTAMGRTNDAIIFGGRVQVFVTGPASDARDLAEKLPANVSKDYGKPFADVFRGVKGDFYKIDSMLFSPAEAIVTAVETGESFRAGGLDLALLQASFGA